MGKLRARTREVSKGTILGGSAAPRWRHAGYNFATGAPVTARDQRHAADRGPFSCSELLTDHQKERLITRDAGVVYLGIRDAGTDRERAGQQVGNRTVHFDVINSSGWRIDRVEGDWPEVRWRKC